jgi:hypothetical protein
MTLRGTDRGETSAAALRPNLAESWQRRASVILIEIPISKPHHSMAVIIQTSCVGAVSRAPDDMPEMNYSTSHSTASGPIMLSNLT